VRPRGPGLATFVALSLAAAAGCRNGGPARAAHEAAGQSVFQAPSGAARGEAGSTGGGAYGDVAHRAASAPIPSRFDIGRPATPAEIAREDIGIRPDGEGLPGGSATARDGAPVWAAKCASCHGPRGEGTAAAPALVGRMPGDAFPFARSMQMEGEKTVGNYWPYATTVFDYVRRAMPFDRPGSLSDHEAYALVAWILAANRIIADTAVMDAHTLPAVRMPARNRFVPDDRLASKTVR
jgi:S-disulfanyl-L-cysteine oxidoreductase SoxD